MPAVCFYFQVHQPFRLRPYSAWQIGTEHRYLDDGHNADVMRRVARKAYLPANLRILELIRRHEGRFRCSYSISGVALEQMQLWAPEVVDSFRALVDTGAVELIAETYYHSLAALFDEGELKEQVRLHGDSVHALFGVRPRVFRNTELIYDDRVGRLAAEMGYAAVLAEGVDDVLAGRSPRFVYRVPGRDARLLLRSYALSDDVAFRFSNRGWPEWPLTADRFASWVHRISGDGDVVNLFMDYETFGEHQWDTTGIFEFLSHLPGAVLAHPHWGFATPSEVVASAPARGELSFGRTTSWADQERDLTAWRGNPMQEAALERVWSLHDRVLATGDADVLHTWRCLLTSDHFYYMCTKWFADGDVHAYFSPFASPYEAAITYRNILDDFERFVLPAAESGARAGGNRVELWHASPDAPRTPDRLSADDIAEITVGSWPIEADQSVWVTYAVERHGRVAEEGRVDAAWAYNAGANSYWKARIGPFAEGDAIRYRIHGCGPSGEADGGDHAFVAGPKLLLAMLWHQHQPLYRDLTRDDPKGSYVLPWVRLHALRDYYGMASIVAQHPEARVTFNLSPVLLWQIEDYLERGATDRALELTKRPVESLSPREAKEVLATFFSADPIRQIGRHARYAELFAKRRKGERFAPGDLTDLQMWASLAWFGQEMREGAVELVTGETVDVARFVEKGRGFSRDDIDAMIDEQWKVMRAVIPIHRQLQEAGRVELSPSPFYHPILPLLIDTDEATIDRPGSTLPERFSYPEDADAQVVRAVDAYRRWFGRPPRGMWPSEGAVSTRTVSVLARSGLRWMASDAGVLAQSSEGRFDPTDPDVLCRPYAARSNGALVSIFFRDTRLSDSIGFKYGAWDDAEAAARDFVREARARFADRFRPGGPRVLAVILDGENCWGGYEDDGRPFLHALYRAIAEDPAIQTVTLAEALEGDPERAVPPIPPAVQPSLTWLVPASWIDEPGSLPGNDLGTWIGEVDENRAWALLLAARRAVDRSGATPASNPRAFHALYAAEGSDWFWWYGDDHTSGEDEVFDDLFRRHLRAVYQALGEEAPASLDEPISPRKALLDSAAPLRSLRDIDRITVESPAAARVLWRVDDGPLRQRDLQPMGGVMGGARFFHAALGPFPGASTLEVQVAPLERGAFEPQGPFSIAIVAGAPV